MTTTDTTSQPTQQRGNTVTTAPSPEAFLAAPPDPDEDDEETPETEHESQPSDPLSSIASSLGQMAAVLTKVSLVEEREDQERLDLLERQYAELEDAYNEKADLIEEVLRLIKPSTAKLSNQIRALLEPPVVPAPSPSTTPEQPADDAPIEDWLAYAAARGLEVDPGRTNRSQIRTALGIPQPVAGGES